MIHNYVFTTSGQIRSRNLLPHPNGNLYGERSRIGCYRWRPWERRVVFFDGFGSIRFVFQQVGEAWELCELPAEAPAGVLTRRGFAELPGLGRIKMRTPPTNGRLTPQRMPRQKQEFEIVVAKYKEDISWTDCFQSNTTVYSKDPNERSGLPVLPNLGREGGTYLFHIVENYNRLADRTLFLQGDPFAHPLLPFEEFASTKSPFAAAPGARQGMNWKVPWSSTSQPIDRPVLMDFLRLLESNPDIPDFVWTQGAQFVVSREQIRKRPLSYYQRLLAITQHSLVTLAGRTFDNHHVAWLFELFWRQVFMADGV